MAATLITPDMPAGSEPAVAPAQLTQPSVQQVAIPQDVEPSINDLAPQPEVPPEAPAPEGEPAEEIEDIDFEAEAAVQPDPRTLGQTNEDRAERRIAAREAARLAQEVTARDARIAELQANQITDADVEQYQ